MMKMLDYEIYMDKVYGGWYGKCLGGAAGAPVEGIKKIIEIDDFTKIMNPDLPNDDLDLQLLWLDVLEQKGIDINSCDLADAWIEKCWYPFSEYGYFIKNYKRGICPPYSGVFNNQFFKEGMGCPIRSEIWGFIFPGNPEMAVRYAQMDGELDHGENSVWAEMFLAAIESELFVESDLQKLIAKGLTYIPSDCKLANCINMIIEDYNSKLYNWEEERKKVLGKFGHPDFTNVTQNIGFVVIALLYGHGNLTDTINVALKCGYDTDCTCATAGAIVGAISGYDAFDDNLKALIKDYFVCGIDVKRPTNSIKDLARDTCRVGVSIGTTVSNFPWRNKNKTNKIDINYIDQPAIGINDKTSFEIVIHNPDAVELHGRLVIGDMPEGWEVESNNINVYIKPYSKMVILNTIFTTESVTVINAVNIINVTLLNINGIQIGEKHFGIAGALIWKAYGPYYDQLDKQPNPSHPSPHGEGCVLPTMECMVNNEVKLDKEYVDEQNLLFLNSLPSIVINAYEDLIPVDKAFTLEGQSCFYLASELISPDEREAWLVIGNNDGYKIWVNGAMIKQKDEMRLWTPYNNCELIKLNKGVNRIVLKLLRRGKTIEFSLGLRKYDGEHWHKNQWFVDFSSGV